MWAKRNEDTYTVKNKRTLIVFTLKVDLPGFLSKAVIVKSHCQEREESGEFPYTPWHEPCSLPTQPVLSFLFFLDSSTNTDFVWAFVQHPLWEGRLQGASLWSDFPSCDWLEDTALFWLKDIGRLLLYMLGTDFPTWCKRRCSRKKAIYAHSIPTQHSVVWGGDSHSCGG